jgi:hypothetical protein
MRLGADDVSWRWIDTLGKEQSGVKWDLVALLSSGTLPPKTLVWKTGWTEWFSASRLAELADALPPSSIEARISPPSLSGVVKPPPLPAPDSRASLVDAEWGSAPPAPPDAPKAAAALLPEPPSEASRAPLERTPAGNLKLPRPNLTPPKIVLPSERQSQPRNDKPAPPPERESPPSSFGLLGLQKEKPKPPTAVVSTQSASFAAFERSTESYAGARPPMPTLSDEAAPATATLRPPAAVPPPPRSAHGGPVLDPRVLSRLGREKSAVDTPLPPAPESEVMTTVPNRSAPIGEITVDDDAVTQRRDALSPVQPQRVPLSREAGTARSPAQTPVLHLLGEARPPMPTIPEALESTLGDARPMQPTIPESAPSLSRAPSELAPAIIHAGPVVELGRSPAPPPPVRRAPPQGPLPQPNLPPPSARPVVKTLPLPAPLEVTLNSGSVSAPRSEARNALSSTGSPAAMEVDARVKTTPHNALEAPPARRLTPARFAVGGVVTACALLSAFLLLSRRDVTGEHAEIAHSASAPPPITSVACRVQAHPARLGATIDRTVTPLLASLQSGRAALGFAESPKKAVGVVIAPDTLDEEPSFEKAFEQPLRSVVPLVASGSANFFARADSDALKNPRAVDGPKPFVIGAGESALMRAAGSEPPEAVWPFPAKSAVSELRVASYPSGHLVTFRVGGLEGKEMVGFMNVDGTKQTELVALDTPKLVGTPFAAVSATHWLVVFAARETSQDPWHVELVTGALGKTQGTRKRFEAPPGGLGGGQIAPSVASLARDHWLLQWTEGKTGMYQVRTLVLDPKLTPVGEPLIVSPKGASSGQGALFAAGDRSVSLYVQTIGGHDELWATTLDCR